MHWISKKGENKHLTYTELKIKSEVTCNLNETNSSSKMNMKIYKKVKIRFIPGLQTKHCNFYSQH